MELDSGDWFREPPLISRPISPTGYECWGFLMPLVVILSPFPLLFFYLLAFRWRPRAVYVVLLTCTPIFEYTTTIVPIDKAMAILKLLKSSGTTPSDTNISDSRRERHTILPLYDDFQKPREGVAVDASRKRCVRPGSAKLPTYRRREIGQS